MQISQQLVKFNRVLTKEINKKVLKTLDVHKSLLMSANHSLASVKQVLTKSKSYWN